MNNNIAAQLHKTLEESQGKCKECVWNRVAIGEEYAVSYCYRKWFFDEECEVQE